MAPPESTPLMSASTTTTTTTTFSSSSSSSSSSASFSDETKPFHILVTGANGGLGLPLTHRLAHQFFLAHPHRPLHLHFTTRTPSKSRLVESHLRAQFPNTPLLKLHPHTLDTSIPSSVLTLARTLPRIDVLVCNAALGGFTGINWPAAIWAVCTDLVKAVTFGEFKLQAVGRLTSDPTPNMPRIGEVFCTNVFGHYLLSREIPGGVARTVFISSLEAHSSFLRLDDIQSLRSEHAYEASKRATDALVLSCRGRPKDGGRFVLAHPGIVASGIVALHWILEYCMFLAFYIARGLGSGWHPISGWKGARAVVDVGLCNEEELDEMESKGCWKVGSGSDRLGREVVRETEVEGGWEEQGKEIWREVERLRGECVRAYETSLGGMNGEKVSGRGSA